MPKYQVLQPIEHNNVLYVAKGAAPGKQFPSGCHGKLIPVNDSGEIQLTEEEASILVNGQVPLVQGKPDPIGGAEAREKKARQDAEKAATQAASEKAEYEEFVAFKAAKAARKEKVADGAVEKPKDTVEEDAAEAKDAAKAPKRKKS